LWVHELILAVAVCVDFLVVAISYGARGIRLSALPSVILSAVGAAVLFLSLLCSAQLTEYIAPSVCRILGGGVLCALGVTNLFQTAIKAMLRRAQGNRHLHFSCGRLNFVLSVFLDESCADEDASESISCKEAFWLSVAFSADSLACGLGAGLQGLNCARAAIFCFVFGLLAVFAGTAIGARLGNLKHDLSWLSGLCLLLIGAVGLAA